MRYGRSRIPLLVLNVIHPLVPEQLLGFLEGKRARARASRKGCPTSSSRSSRLWPTTAASASRIHGKDTVAAPGEYVPEVVLAARGALPRRRRRDAAAPRSPRHVGRGRADPARRRCPSGRPPSARAARSGRVFSALKIAQRRAGRDHVARRHRLPRLRHAAAVQHGQHHPRLRDGTGLVGRGGARTSASA